jgi:cytidylate kinase
VRAVLVEQQREYGHGGGIVMEGRDIGTVVFPAADVKVFLDAAPEERARRRAIDPAHTSLRDSRDAQGVAQALEARDLSDRTRAASPLRVAPDAIYIDTTGVSVSDVVDKVMDVVRGATEK